MTNIDIRREVRSTCNILETADRILIILDSLEDSRTDEEYESLERRLIQVIRDNIDTVNILISDGQEVANQRLDKLFNHIKDESNG